jgi:hypothetical protein
VIVENEYQGDDMVDNSNHGTGTEVIHDDDIEVVQDKLKHLDSNNRKLVQQF